MTLIPMVTIIMITINTFTINVQVIEILERLCLKFLESLHANIMYELLECYIIQSLL